MRPAGKRVQDSGMPGMRQLRHHPLHVQVAVLSLLREEVPRQDIRIGPGEALRRPAPAVRLLRSGGATAVVPEIPRQARRPVRFGRGDLQRHDLPERPGCQKEGEPEARVHIVPPHVRKRPEMASASPCAGRGELFRERREAAPYLLLPLRGDAEEIQVRAPLPKGRMAHGERAAREARLPAGVPPCEEKVHERLLRVRPEKEGTPADGLRDAREIRRKIRLPSSNQRRENRPLRQGGKDRDLALRPARGRRAGGRGEAGAAVRDGYRLRVHRTPPHPHPGREVPPDPVLRVLLQPDAFAPAPPEDVLGAGVLGSPAVPPLGEQADVGLRIFAPALRMRG